MALSVPMHLIALFFFFATSENLSLAFTVTNPTDVSALQALYAVLNAPPQLVNWSSAGGDPCGKDQWMGVTCSGDLVVELKINGLGLNGILGSQLSHFSSLQYLDASFNNIGGGIPEDLPPNATYINLAVNNFTWSIPYLLPSLQSLKLLNLSHNSLSGPIGNVFTDMHKLEQLDLSFNFLAGGLPISFTSLVNLHELYLQDNQFSGSVNFLANLPLSVLYLENNRFSGFIPRQFALIPELRINGNMFQPGFASSTPLVNDSKKTPLVLPNWNVSHSPSSASGSFDYSPVQVSGNNQKKLRQGAVAGVAFGVVLLALLVAAVIIVKIHRSSDNIFTKQKGSDDSLLALRVAVPSVLSLNLDKWPPTTSTKKPLSVHQKRSDKSSKRKSTSRKTRNHLTVKPFSASELLVATNNYNEQRVLGRGPNGCVYKAEFPDGQVFAVKKIDLVPLAVCQEDDFVDLIMNMSRLRHPNINRFVGYCVEQGQHILVYEYARNKSLADVLYSSNDRCMAISWKSRVRIILGVAHALEYMHCVCLPPLAHENIKATNILLDNHFMPHITDPGVALLRPLIKCKLETSGSPTDFNGYAAPEQNIPKTNKMKEDIYSFGVVMLEILTGRRAFDISRRKEEQFLVKWASYRLHDFSLLEDLVDPSIRGTISPQVLSRFADIILLCIQPEPEFRAPMTEIVEKMVRLAQKMDPDGISSSADASDIDISDLSFKSTVAYFDQPSVDP